MLELLLKDDLLGGEAGLAQQDGPQIHPVETCSVVHDEQVTLSGLDAVTGDHHAHAQEDLQESLAEKQKLSDMM